MGDHWRTELEEILEKNCTGMDDHDGQGGAGLLVDRCEKCRMMYAALTDLIKKVRDQASASDLKHDALTSLFNGADQNRKIAEKLLSSADEMAAAAARLAE